MIQVLKNSIALRCVTHIFKENKTIKDETSRLRANYNFFKTIILKNIKTLCNGADIFQTKLPCILIINISYD